jgi:glucokinase
MSAVVALDWGGTWLRAALVSRGVILSEVYRQPRPSTVSGQLDLVEEMFTRLNNQAHGGVVGAGVAICGIVQDRGTVASAGNIGMNGLDLRTELATRLGCEVSVVNDVQAAALAESADAPPGSTVVLLAVGTGVGGAIVEGGRLILGRGAAGDFGHTCVDVAGPPCFCGGRGCLERLASGRVLNDAARDLADSGKSRVLGAVARRRAVHAGDLDAAALQRDPGAVEVMRAAATTLAAGIRNVAAASDPDLLVLGGGALSPGSYLRAAVKAAWEEQRSPWTHLELVEPKWGDDAGLLGASLLFNGERTSEVCPQTDDQTD